MAELSLHGVKMILGNNRLLFKTPVSFIGGTTLCGEPSHFNKSGKVYNRYYGGASITKNSGTPNGYRFPGVFVSPIKNGGLSSNTLCSFTFSSVPNLNGARNGEGTSGISITSEGTLKGIGDLESNSSFSLASSATLKATGGLVGTSATSFTPSSTLSALGYMVSSPTITFTSSGTGDAEIYSSGSSSITFSATGTLTGAISGSGSSSFALSTSAGLKGIAVLEASPSFSFSASLTRDTAKGYLVASPTILFSGSGTLKGVGLVSGSTEATGEELTAAEIATTVWDKTISGNKTATTILIEARQNALNAFGAASS